MEANIINRLCIYFFYDKDGIIDRYVINMLNGLKPFFKSFIFVSNGSLKSESKILLSNFPMQIIERENKGFDVWAYKDALQHCTFTELENYDEIVMMNYTIMGPVYPFSEVFSKTEKCNYDFWGLTAYYDLPEVSVKKCKYGYIPFHIQSHFIAVRKNMFMSRSFREYWDKMPMIHSYNEAVFLHEAIFTKHFADLGFEWGVYADTEDLREHNLCPIIYSPVKLIKGTRCPIFKRRSFFHDTADLQTWSMGSQARQLLDFLDNETTFDTSLIWDNILRTCDLSNIQRCLGYLFVPTENQCNAHKSLNTALVIHIYYEDTAEFCLHYAQAMPDGSDVYITTTSEEKAMYIKKTFSAYKQGNVSVIIIENQGRDISSLLIGVREIVKSYDLVCFAHDKKSHKNVKKIIGEEFSLHCFDNILGSKSHVVAIINEFIRSPRLGLLSPPPPFHSSYTQVIGNEWTCNYEQTKALAQKLNINVPINSHRIGTAPLGTMFWFRPQALSPLLDYDWEYNDFPEEPNGVDGTVLHAIERLYPYAAQSAGYFSLWCLKASNEMRYISSIYSMLQDEAHNKKHQKISSILFLRLKEFIKRKMSPERWEKLKKTVKKITH